MLAISIFLASAVIAATAVGASILAGRKVAGRVAAGREADFRALFASRPPADPSAKVEVLLEDGEPRTAWHRAPVGWIDVERLLPIEAPVVGWRRHPFAAGSDDDPFDWPSDRIDAEMARRFPAPAKRFRLLGSDYQKNN